MKSIEITVDFPIYCNNPYKIILDAIKKKLPKIKVSKIRYTYIESNYGLCDFPAGLMLAVFMHRAGPLEGFNSHVTKCSGTYKLKFK